MIAEKFHGSPDAHYNSSWPLTAKAEANGSLKYALMKVKK
jgi:hypothetical protein